MPRSTAWTYVGVVIAGLVLPYFVWSDYLGIYTFASERKGNDWLDIAGACSPVRSRRSSGMEKRSSFNDEDRIGWSLVPFALFAGLLANSGRHLLIALIVPDRRAGRNLAAAVTLALHALVSVCGSERPSTSQRPSSLCSAIKRFEQRRNSFPLTGSRHSGAISASGASTNRRSRKRGCGTSSPGSVITASVG